MINFDQLKQLREKTGVPMNDCQQAPKESGGDIEKAVSILKEKSKVVAAKKATSQAQEGVVEAYIHANRKIGVLVELNCQTDFVARNKDFLTLAHDLAMHIAAMDPQYISCENIPKGVIEEEKKLFCKQLKDSGKPQQVLEKIIEGKLEKFFSQVCLYNQAFIKKEEQTIKELIDQHITKLGENIKVGRFVRFSVTNRY